MLLAICLFSKFWYNFYILFKLWLQYKVWDPGWPFSKGLHLKFNIGTQSSFKRWMKPKMFNFFEITLSFNKKQVFEMPSKNFIFCPNYHFPLVFFPLFAHYFWTKANEGFSWHYSRIYCSVKTSFPFKKGFTFRSCDDINVKGIFDARLDILPWLDNVVTVPCKKVLSLTVQDFLRSPHKSLKVPLPLSKDLTSHFVFFN